MSFFRATSGALHDRATRTVCPFFQDSPILRFSLDFLVHQSHNMGCLKNRRVGMEARWVRRPISKLSRTILIASYP